MSKKNVTFSVDEDIAQSFKEQHENQSKKIEELMENTIIDDDELQELKNKLLEYQDKEQKYRIKQKAVEQKIKKIKTQTSTDKILDTFIDNQIKKYKQDLGTRWDDFEEFWNKFGKGIEKQFNSLEMSTEDLEVKEMIRVRLD